MILNTFTYFWCFLERFYWKIYSEHLFRTFILNISLPRGNFCVLFTWIKVTSARRVTRCCTTGNPPLKVAPGQWKTHVNSYRCQTMHRGKVDPGVSELPRGDELSRDHVNRPLVQNYRRKCDQMSHHIQDKRNILDHYICFEINCQVKHPNFTLKISLVK